MRKLRSTNGKLCSRWVQDQELGWARLAAEALLGQIGPKKQRRQGHNKNPIAKSHLQETLYHDNRIRGILNNEK